MTFCSASRTWRAAALLASAFCLGSPAAARAHDPGLSSLEVRVARDRIAATLVVAASDARVAAGASGIEMFALESIELRLEGVRLQGAVESRATGPAGTKVVLAFDRVAGSRLTVHSDVPRRLALGHRELLTVRTDSGVLTEQMLDARDTGIDVDLGVVQPADMAAQFLGLGTRHILGGYDHLLFITALLLGVRRLGSVVTTVTAFTVAHSLTLALAVLGLVDAPAALIEPLIAASIVFVGVENLLRPQIDSRWKLTFVFGLVHGFGFAGALQELGVGARGIGVATPLGWFNAGVEIGQIGVALLMWPLVRGMNAKPMLRFRLAAGFSVLVAAAGAYWLMERTVFA